MSGQWCFSTAWQYGSFSTKQVVRKCPVASRPKANPPIPANRSSVVIKNSLHAFFGHLYAARFSRNTVQEPRSKQTIYLPAWVVSRLFPYLPPLRASIVLLPKLINKNEKISLSIRYSHPAMPVIIPAINDPKAISAKYSQPILLSQCLLLRILFHTFLIITAFLPKIRGNLRPFVNNCPYNYPPGA